MLIYERSETEEIKVNCTELLERFMIENGIDKCHMKKVEANTIYSIFIQGNIRPFLQARCYVTIHLRLLLNKKQK
jgi:hypothetical protein